MKAFIVCVIALFLGVGCSAQKRDSLALSSPSLSFSKEKKPTVSFFKRLEKFLMASDPQTVKVTESVVNQIPTPLIFRQDILVSRLNAEIKADLLANGYCGQTGIPFK